MSKFATLLNIDPEISSKLAEFASNFLGEDVTVKKSFLNDAAAFLEANDISAFIEAVYTIFDEHIDSFSDEGKCFCKK